MVAQRLARALCEDSLPGSVWTLNRKRYQWDYSGVFATARTTYATGLLKEMHRTASLFLSLSREFELSLKGVDIPVMICQMADTNHQRRLQMAVRWLIRGMRVGVTGGGSYEVCAFKKQAAPKQLGEIPPWSPAVPSACPGSSGCLIQSSR
jgi:hypothetical protein